MQTNNYSGLCIDGPLKGQFRESVYNAFATHVPKNVAQTMVTKEEAIVPDLDIVIVRYDHMQFTTWGKTYGIWVSGPTSLSLLNFNEEIQAFSKFLWKFKKPSPLSAPPVPEWLKVKMETGAKEFTTNWQYRWWFSARHDRDMYELFVVRHPEGLNSHNYLEYEDEHYALNGEGQWYKYNPGTQLVACLRIPGIMVHVLTAAGALREKRNEIADILTELVDHIVNNTAKDLIESTEVESGTS